MIAVLTAPTNGALMTPEQEAAEREQYDGMTRAEHEAWLDDLRAGFGEDDADG